MNMLPSSTDVADLKVAVDASSDDWTQVNEKGARLKHHRLAGVIYDNGFQWNWAIVQEGRNSTVDSGGGQDPAKLLPVIARRLRSPRIAERAAKQRLRPERCS